MSIEIIPLAGIPEIAAGDDLGGILAGAAREELRDGDVLVVTQKVVSKAEGRVVAEGEGKEAWVAREARRVVARRGDLVIAETRHGFVCANAGVDASNVAPGFLSLLPEDPDGSARRIREAIESKTGRAVGVVVTDTFGRPWRRGLVNVAIGCDGFPSLADLRGTRDATGRTLEATVVALADEVAAAAGLAMAKSDGIPAAIVRGVHAEAPAAAAAALVRSPEEDLFRQSPLTSIETRRTIRGFGDGEVPREAVQEAVRAALAAPVPHGSRHPSRPWLWIVLDSPTARWRVLGAMAAAWARDLRWDGADNETIRRRRERSDDLLGRAPTLAIPLVSLEHADDYPDERRREAERDMFLLATGAAVQNFMLALHAQGLGSAWVSSTLFCKDETRKALGVEAAWLPMGAVAVGPPPPSAPPPRPPIDPDAHLRYR